jgi:hypothetical protein
MRGQHFEEEPCLGVHEMKVGEPRTIPFPHRALDSLTYYIDSNAELFRMRFGVSGQKVAVPAAEFPHK